MCTDSFTQTVFHGNAFYPNVQWFNFSVPEPFPSSDSLWTLTATTNVDLNLDSEYILLQTEFTSFHLFELPPFAPDCTTINTTLSFSGADLLTLSNQGTSEISILASYVNVQGFCPNSYLSMTLSLVSRGFVCACVHPMTG